MARMFECPKCKADISESHESYDPDVGIMTASWYCDACNEAYVDYDDDEPEGV